MGVAGESGLGTPGANESPAVLSDDPKTVLQAFLSARTASQRLPFVLHAKMMQQELEDYAKGKAFTAVDVQSIEESYRGVSPSSGREAILYRVVTGENPMGYQVAVEKTDDGYKIDWLFFIHCEDRLLEKFVSAGRDGDVGQFLVVAKQSHSFDPLFSKRAGFLCFTLRPPYFDPPFEVFVRLDDAQAESLNEAISWGKNHCVVAELEWVKVPKSGRPYVTIRRIVRPQWRIAY